MIKHFKRLGKQVLVYGLGDTINKLIGILILPLFSRFLTPSDYGVAGILVITNTLILGLCDLGMSNGMARFFHEEKDKDKVFSTAQMAMLAITVIIAVLGWIFSPFISQALFKSSQYAQVVGYSFLTIPFSIAVTAPFMRLRLMEKAKTYAFFSVSRVITGVLLNFILIVVFHFGLKGYILGPLINATLYALVLTIYTRKDIGFTFDRVLFRKMFKFGFPFVLGLMSFWIMDWADRIILTRYTNLAEVGLYNLGYTLGMASMLVVGSFQTAWTPFYLSISKELNAKKIYSAVMTYYSLGIGFVVLLLAVFGRDYFTLTTPAAYHTAYIVIPLVSLAYAFKGNFSIVAVGGFLNKKPIFEVSSDIAAVLINLVLMFLLIPHYGRIGAAWATVVSYASLPTILFFLTRKIFPIKYEYGRLLRILIVGLGLYFVCHFIYAETTTNLILRLGIVILYPILFLITGFFSEGELRRINAIKHRIFARKS